MPAFSQVFQSFLVRLVFKGHFSQLAIGMTWTLKLNEGEGETLSSCRAPAVSFLLHHSIITHHEFPFPANSCTPI